MDDARGFVTIAPAVPENATVHLNCIVERVDQAPDHVKAPWVFVGNGGMRCPLKSLKP